MYHSPKIIHDFIQNVDMHYSTKMMLLHHFIDKADNVGAFAPDSPADAVSRIFVIIIGCFCGLLFTSVFLAKIFGIDD